MGVLRVCLAGAGMLFGGVATSLAGPASLAVDAGGEAACCAAILGDGGGERMSTGVDHLQVGVPTMRPTACLQHGCGALRWDAPVEVGVGSPAKAAINQQVGLRAKPTCDASEWHDRCPSGSAMILAHRRGGCVAAGCVGLEEEGLAALEGVEDDGDTVLRAVVAQEAHRLREAGVARTFHTHSSRLREDFEKSQKKLLSELKKTMTVRLPSRDDAEHARALVEEAAANGFSNALIDDAKRAVLRHDGEQRAWSLWRNLSKAFLSKMVERRTAARKEMAAKTGLIASLQDQVYDLVVTVDKAGEAAVFQEQRFAEVRRMHQADLDAGAAREAELEEEIMDLDSNVRWVTKVWGDKVLRAEEEVEVAVAANDRAQAKVVELTSQLELTEKVAVAERGHHDAAKFALREELARLHQTADAAAKRCLEEQERLHAERAVAVLERDGALVSLASCAVHVEEVHSRSVDLFLAVSEAANAGQDPVTDTNQQEAPSAVREKDGIALEEVSERTRARLDEVETTVAAAVAWREEALHACGASLDALREDFVEVEKLLVMQEEDTASAKEHGFDLEEELAFSKEMDAKTRVELDGCYADLAEIDSPSADLANFVLVKAFVAGSTIHHSDETRLETALDRGLPREDVKATSSKLHTRFKDIELTVDSLAVKRVTELGTCVQDLQQARMREKALESSCEISSGLLVGHDIGDDVEIDHGARSDSATWLAEP